jgi:hypothetical protein
VEATGAWNSVDPETRRNSLTLQSSEFTKPRTPKNVIMANGSFLFAMENIEVFVFGAF